MTDAKEENGTNEPPVELEEETEEPAPKNDGYYPSGRTIYVTNLPVEVMFTYIQDLFAVFNKHGEIKCVKRGGIEIGKHSEASEVLVTFSAYVYYKDTVSSDKAVSENGTLIGGNPVSVYILRAGPYCAKLDNLPVHASEDCLRNLFKHCGPIVDVKKIPGRRVAFIDFENEEGVNRAISLNGKLLMNNAKLSVERSRPATKKPPTGKPRKNGEGSNPNFRTAGSWQTDDADDGPFRPPRGGPANRRGQWGGRGTRNFRGGPRFGGPPNFWGGDFRGTYPDGNRTVKRKNPTDWMMQY